MRAGRCLCYAAAGARTDAGSLSSSGGKNKKTNSILQSGLFIFSVQVFVLSAAVWATKSEIS